MSSKTSLPQILLFSFLLFLSRAADQCTHGGEPNLEDQPVVCRCYTATDPPSPSPSLSPSPEPSPSRSPSPSASPSVSSSPSPSPSPSPPPLPALSFNATFVADNAAIVYIHAKPIATTSRYNEQITFSYSGACSPALVLNITNFDESTTGFSLLIQRNPSGTLYGVNANMQDYQVAGTQVILATVKQWPEGDFTVGDEGGYDYSQWTGVVLVTGLMKPDNPNHFQELAEKGAPAVGWGAKRVEKGIYGYRVPLPWC